VEQCINHEIWDLFCSVVNLVGTHIFGAFSDTDIFTVVLCFNMFANRILLLAVNNKQPINLLFFSWLIEGDLFYWNDYQIWRQNQIWLTYIYLKVSMFKSLSFLDTHTLLPREITRFKEKIFCVPRGAVILDKGHHLTSEPTDLKVKIQRCKKESIDINSVRSHIFTV
jgi:hypothetical protein